MYKQVLTFLTILTLLEFSEGYTILTAVACDGDMLEVHCPPGEKIVIVHADYGRWDMDTCVPYNAHNLRTDCHSAFANTVIKMLCNGQEYCEIKPEHIAYNDPCPGQDKYAEVQFQCVPEQHLHKFIT